MVSGGSACAKHPVPAAIAVVFNGESVLLVRRANPPDAGLWGFPGGKMEMGEGVRDTAVRELLEETGIRAEPLDVLTAVDVFERDGKGTARDDTGVLTRQFLLVAVLCRYLSGQARPDDDALEARWFSPAEMDELETVPYLSRDVINVLRRARASIEELRANTAGGSDPA